MAWPSSAWIWLQRDSMGRQSSLATGGRSRRRGVLGVDVRVVGVGVGDRVSEGVQAREGERRIEEQIARVRFRLILVPRRAAAGDVVEELLRIVAGAELAGEREL